MLILPTRDPWQWASKLASLLLIDWDHVVCVIVINYSVTVRKSFQSLVQR